MRKVQVQNILTEKETQIYYFDPKTNSYRTMEARRAVSQQNYRGFSTSGYEFWTDAVVTFTER